MKNETFEQLMIGGAEVALSDDQRQFVATHRRILACGNMAGQYLVEMAQNLKAMRDGKLYRAAGFAEFRDYVREAIGIEERQAYNYIRVAEGLPRDFLAEHAGLGITKLSILAAAEPEDREKAIESGAADASVRALQRRSANWKPSGTSRRSSCLSSRHRSRRRSGRRPSPRMQGRRQPMQRQGRKTTSSGPAKSWKPPKRRSIN